jgi:hypothetical protein
LLVTRSELNNNIIPNMTASGIIKSKRNGGYKLIDPDNIRRGFMCVSLQVLYPVG